MSSIATTPTTLAGVLSLRSKSIAKRDGARLAVATTAAAVALLPMLVPRGPGNTSPIDMLLILAAGTALLWVGISGQRLRFPYAAALALFIAGGALGALAGPVPGSGILAVSQDLLLLVWCWVIVNVASSPERLRILLGAWVYSSIIWALILLGGLAAGSRTIAGQTTRNAGRTALTFVDPNVAANYYVISMMIICATQRPRRRSARVAAYGLLLVALFTTGSNSGAVSLALAVIVASLLGLRRRLGPASAIAGLAVVVLGGFLVAANVSLTSIEAKAHDSKYSFVREGIGRGDKSVSQRETLVQESTRLYETGGLLGQGPVSTKFRLEAEMAPFEKEAHNDYFAALTERGPIGFLGLFLLVLSIGIRAFCVASRRLSTGFAAIVVRPNALFGAVVGTMAASTVYELLHVRQVWALFAFVAAIFVWGRE